MARRVVLPWPACGSISDPQMMLRATALLIALALPAFASAGEAPQRVVSLNLCADQLLVRLLPRERVAGLTWLAADPRSSTVAEEARGLPATGGSAEEVLRLRPGLVVAGRYTTRQTVDVLRRAGQPVIDLDVPGSFADAQAQIRALAEELGVPERGRELAAALDSGPPSGEAQLRALVLGAYGSAAGPGSILDEVLARAGYRNLAAEIAPNGGDLPLERVLMVRPDVLILDSDPRGPALASEVLNHPALRKLGRQISVISLPSRLWTCAGPHLAEAVAVLREARPGLKAPDAF
jgi:iron complex transport system substrate-binding protein